MRPASNGGLRLAGWLAGSALLHLSSLCPSAERRPLAPLVRFSQCWPGATMCKMHPAAARLLLADRPSVSLSLALALYCLPDRVSRWPADAGTALSSQSKAKVCKIFARLTVWSGTAAAAAASACCCLRDLRAGPRVRRFCNV